MGHSKEEALKLIEASEATEFVVRTAADEVAFLKSYTDNEVQKSIGDRVSEIHSRYDQDIFEILGTKKKPDEHTYGFLKRELKRLTDIKNEYEILKDKSPDDSGIEAVRQAAIARENELLDKLSEKDNELINKDNETDFMQALSGIKFADNLPKSAVDALVNTVKAEIVSSAKIIDGKRVYVDADGEPMIDKTTYKPITAKALLEAKLTDVIQKDRVVTGAGTPPKVVTGKDGKASVQGFIMPGDVNTKQALVEHLKKTGIPRGSKEYDAIWKEYSPDLKLQ